MVLIKGKREEHLATCDKLDHHNNFHTIVMKWKKVLIIVMNASCSQHLKNCPMCKDKWGSIYGDFKKKLIT
jgi:hypothetical protein